MKRECVHALAAAVGAALCATAAAQSPQDEEGSSKDYEESIAFADYLGSDDLRASELLGGLVLDESGEEVGEIEDLIVSRDDDVVTAVVAVGGFLDVGSKLVGVSYEELRISPEGEDFYLAMSAEELEALPEYQFEERDSESLADLQDRATPRSGSAGAEPSDAQVNDADSDDSQGSDAAANDSTDGANAAGRAAAEVVVEQREQREAVSRNTVVAKKETSPSSEGQVSGQHSSEHPAAAQQSGRSATDEIETLQSADRRASDLIGAKVFTVEGDEVGEIDDLVVSTEDQSLQAVLSVGGLLGVGERLIKVSLEELQLERSGESQGADPAVRLSMSVDDLKARPVFQYDDTEVSSAGPF